MTLVAEQGAKCWGMAFRVPEEEVKKTREYLDYREKAGYTVGSLFRFFRN